MHKNSMKLMRYFRDKYCAPGMSVIDIGSRRVIRTHNSYRRIFRPPFQYTGMDIEPGRNVDIVGYETLSIYDILISGQVMEHVKRPWDWLKNLTQYFTEYICVIVPNTIREHKYPIDTYRYFPDGMRDLFEYAGIEELEIFANRGDTIGVGKGKQIGN